MTARRVFHVSDVWIVVATDRSVIAVHSMERDAHQHADREGFAVERWPIEQTQGAIAWAAISA